MKYLITTLVCLAGLAPAQVRTLISGAPILGGPTGTPTMIAVAPSGDVYFTVAAHRAVMRYDARTGESTSVTKGRPSWHRPSGIALDAAGNVYVADPSGGHVYRIVNGEATPIAGNGLQGYNGDDRAATSAMLGNPLGLAVAPNGDFYIAEWARHRVRKVSNGIITTVIGPEHLKGPSGVALDASGALYVADTNGARVLKLAKGVITTFAGTGVYGDAGDGGAATRATLRNPCGVAVDKAGRVFIADAGANRIRVVSKGVITAVKTPGVELNWPRAVGVDASGTLYIADTRNFAIRAVTMEGSK